MAIVQVKIIEGPKETGDWSLEAKVNLFLKKEIGQQGDDRVIDIKLTPGMITDKAYVLPTAMIIYKGVPS